MADVIKTVTDKTQFATLFNNFFDRRDVYIKTKSGDLTIQFLGYSNDNVAFRIPRVKNVPDMVLVFTRKGEHTIYTSLKYLERNEDTFIFLPVKFQIISASRREGRANLDTDGGKNIFYIENIVSDNIIQQSLVLNDKKIEHIKHVVIDDLKNSFERIRIVLIHETKIDPRMKYFQENIRPILIEDLKSKPSEKFASSFNLYVNEIYSRDYKLSSQSEFISEVSVPILYKNMIPYGYIQVNNTWPMTESYLNAVKKAALGMNELILNDNLFEKITERFLVSDVSRSGMGIVFKNRRHTTYFRQDSIVSFDMILPDKKKVVIGAEVKNTIFMDNSIIKVGLEIINIDAISEVHFQEFVDKLNQ